MRVWADNLGRVASWKVLASWEAKKSLHEVKGVERARAAASYEMLLQEIIQHVVGVSG